MFKKIVAFFCAVMLCNAVAFANTAETQMSTAQVREALIGGYQSVQNWDDATWQSNTLALAAQMRAQGQVEMAKKLEILSNPAMKAFALEQTKNQINQISENGLGIIYWLVLTASGRPITQTDLILIVVLVVVTFGDNTAASEA